MSLLKELNETKVEKVQLEESNDEVMFKEELKDIGKAISKAWSRAQHLDMDFEEFLHVVKQVSDETLKELD